jgi:hypothetical protein
MNGLSPMGRGARIEPVIPSSDGQKSRLPGCRLISLDQFVEVAPELPSLGDPLLRRPSTFLDGGILSSLSRLRSNSGRSGIGIFFPLGVYCSSGSCLGMRSG